MTVWTALATTPDEPRGQALAEALERLGPTGVACLEIEDGHGRFEVGGYFDAAPDGVALALLAAAFDATPFAVSRLDPTDWVAQVRRELTPVRAGRFVVHGGHDRDRVPANAWALEIEAAMAFGTGHHGTTQGCLEAFERLRKQGFAPRHVRDVGCGTGVLAMGVAKATLRGPRAQALATDIDPVAVATARANVRANGVGGRVRAAQAAGFRGVPHRNSPKADLLLMNILARPLMRLAPAARDALAPGGVAILSGLLERQEREVLAVYRALGFRLLFTLRRRGWATLALRRGGAQTKSAARRPRRM